MSAAAQTSFPRLDGRRSSGVWAGVAGVGVLAVLLGYFVYSYFYLMVTAEDWPPAATPDPPLLRPLGLLALLLMSALAARRSGRPLRPGERQVGVALALALLALIGTIVLVAGADLVGDLALDPRDDAYSAIVTTLHAFHGAVTAAGVVIAAVTGYETYRLGTHPWVAAAAAVASVWWCWVIAGWVVIMGVVYLSPQLT